MSTHARTGRAISAGVVALMAMLFGGASPIWAEVTATGSTSGNGFQYIVGYTADGTLQIDTGSVVSDYFGYLGFSSGTNGTVTVTDSGSAWTNMLALYVGYMGVGTLNIQNAGLVSGGSGYVGTNVGSTGTVGVSGSDSKWSSSTLYVGLNGTGSLNIQDGGQVSSGPGYLGFYNGSTGTAIVSGANSQWINSSVLYVGYNGSGSLTVADGGLVTAKALYASVNDLHGDGTITANGAVLDGDLVFDSTHGVTQAMSFGTGGALNLAVDGTGTLGVGYKGTGSLQIADGLIVASTTGYLGYNAGSSGAATVTGAGSQWTNSASLYVGYNGTGSLTVSDGGLVTAKTLYASVSDLHGDGTITANGAILDGNIIFDSTHGLMQSASFGTGGTLNLSVDGTGSLGIGYKGTGSLQITDGLSVTSTYGYLGYNTGTTGTATVMGAGSKWVNSSSIYVGYKDTGTLNIQAGGQVGNTDSGYGAYIGYNSTATGTVTVTGTNSKWTSASSLYVGNSGNGTLNIQDGGQVSDTNGYLGYNTSSIGAATVIGNGSTWNNSGSLYVGYDGSGSLTVADGGLVTAKILYASGSDLHGDGTITVTGGGILDADLVFDASHGQTSVSTFGTGGTLNVTTDGSSVLGIGHSGTGSLRVADGQVIQSTPGYLGYSAGSAGTAIVTGNGSKWTIADLYVGYAGNGMLNIENDASVVNSASGYLGYNVGSTGIATVTGTNSQWTNYSAKFFVGYNGNGTLNVLNGAYFNASSTYLGYNVGSGGSVTVNGTGSAWTNFSSAYVGYNGNGTLNIQDGGTVTNTYGGYMGYNPGSIGTATVTGAGSKWTAPLYVGYSGTGTLTVENGGQVSSTSDYLGYNIGSIGTATVTGTGSTWTNNVKLYVGYSGQGTLSVQDGGQMTNSTSSSDTYLGYNAGAIGNVTVSGASSKWTSYASLYVGYNGSGSLTVDNGGLVTAKTLYASMNDLHGNGTITVNGGAVLDTNLIFDSSHDLTQSLAFGSGGTLNLTVYGTSNMGAGYKGTGSLRIADGRTVASSTGYLGYNSGSVGTATVTGDNSKWTNSSALIVGYYGNGELNVLDGAYVSIHGPAQLGMKAGSTGTALVKGIGSQWVIDSAAYMGSSGNGFLTVEDGAQVTSNGGYLGYEADATGTVTVSGTGSTWTVTNLLRVGYYGTGSLTVDNGGLVTVQKRLYIGSSGAAGSLNVNNGGSVSTMALYASFNDLRGNGTITVVGGGVLDTNLIFDNTQGLTQSLAFGNGGTLNLTVDGTADFGVGYKDTGSLRIADGMTVASTGGYLGFFAGSSGTANVTGMDTQWNISGNNFNVGLMGNGLLNILDGGHVNSISNSYIGRHAGSVGTVMVDGASSTWANSYALYVGYGGNGSLSITNGGHVSNAMGNLGNDLGTTGIVTVTGVDSQWINTGILYVGFVGNGTVNIQGGGQISSNFDAYLAYGGGATGTAMVTDTGSKLIVEGLLNIGWSGTGIMTVADGGQVTAKSLSVTSRSQVRLHVSGDDMIVLGTSSSNGSVSNNGAINFYADALLAARVYSPISEFAGRTMTWAGTGTYNAFGGTWDSINHTFTVTSAVTGNLGDAVDVADGGRVVVTDPTSGHRVGASFQPGSGAILFSASNITGDEQSALTLMLTGNQSILSGYDFTLDGYTPTPGNAVYLSIFVGAGFTADALAVWHLDHATDTWSLYTPTDFSYDGQYAYFTVTGFSGYAVTGTIPEPTTMALLALGGIGSLVRRRNVRNRDC